MRRLFQWFAMWLDTRERQDFYRGYDWAAGELLRSNGMSDTVLERHVDVSVTFHDKMPFDHGVTAAIKDWRATIQ